MLATPPRYRRPAPGSKAAAMATPAPAVNDLGFWLYLYVMRAARFERHIRSCPACGTGPAATPYLEPCDHALTLAGAADEAAAAIEGKRGYGPHEWSPSAAAE